MRRGQLDSALRDVDAAASRYRDNSDWAIRLRILRAHVVFLRGSYREALQLLAAELPPSLARTDVAVHRQLVQGLAYTYLQQFDQADAILTQAENLARATDSGFQGDLAQARGILEIDRKRYDLAEAAFRRALSFARQKNLPFLEALALGNLGNVAMWQEHYDQAIDRYRLALQKSQSIGSVSSVAGVLGNMGWSYSTVGDFELAASAFAQAREKAQQAGLVDQQIYWLGSLAGVYSQQHRYAEADSLSQQAVALAEKQDDQQTLTECLNTRSEIALAMGRFDDAEKFNAQAVRIENAGQDQFGVNNSQLLAGRIAAGRENYPQARLHFEKILGDPHAETALKWEAHARLAQLFAAQLLPARAELEFRIAIKTIQNAQRSINSDEFRVSFLSNAIDFYDSYVNFLIERRRPLDALKVADLTRAQSFERALLSASGADPARLPFTPQATSHRLNATLLFFWLGRQKSWLWVVTPTSTSLFPLPAEGELDGLVKLYRESFNQPRDPLEAANPDGSKLYSALIQPAEKLFPKNGRIVILPDGSLNSLNFETLIVPVCAGPCSPTRTTPQPHYWIDDVTIITANSLSRLARSSVSAPPKQPDILLVGKALFASPDFPPIAQAGKEIGLLEKYFSADRRQELTEGKATASEYLSSHPERFSYLHFTTHGTASRLQPLESAIILSPDGDSFKLYARDILQHPLAAYLVTISACNGAGTKTYAGEGLVGLSWAFLRAGAQNVIAGLWEVSNASTPQLMDELYKNLSAGQDPAAALRNAKLTLVHTSGNYRRPFYWAPFLLYSGS